MSPDGDIVPGDLTPGDLTPGDMVPGDLIPGDMVPGDLTPGGGAVGLGTTVPRAVSETLNSCFCSSKMINSGSSCSIPGDGGGGGNGGGSSINVVAGTKLGLYILFTSV